MRITPSAPVLDEGQRLAMAQKADYARRLSRLRSRAGRLRATQTLLLVVAVLWLGPKLVRGSMRPDRVGHFILFRNSA